MRERESTAPTLEERVAKLGSFAAHFACGFSSFGGVDSRSLIVFPEDFARESLLISDDYSIWRFILWIFCCYPGVLWKPQELSEIRGISCQGPQTWPEI